MSKKKAIPKDSTNVITLSYRLIELSKCQMDSNLDTLLKYVSEHRNISGFNINIRDEIGNTPLHYAAIYQNIQMIDCLLQHDADPSSTNLIGQTYHDILLTKHSGCIN